MYDHQFDWSHLALGGRNLLLGRSDILPSVTKSHNRPSMALGVTSCFQVGKNFENRTGVENGAHSRCKNLLNSPSDVKHLIDTILKQLFQAVSCILCYENLRC